MSPLLRVRVRNCLLTKPRYVLSPTHLHEFKSADRVAWQTPVMSLYLPEQKLGSHSQEDSSSHKFMLKGRQTGAMHRGHSWVFRAESHETMMSWYEDIEGLGSKTGEARNAFVRKHVRSVSGRSMNSEVMEDDEADRTPYSAGAVVMSQDRPTSSRQAGGAFPSDVQIDRQAPLSPSSGDSSAGRDMIAAAGSYPDGSSAFDGNSRPVDNRELNSDSYQDHRFNEEASERSRPEVTQHDSYYGGWIGPSAIVAKQRQSQQLEDSNAGDHEIRSSNPDDREIQSEGDQVSLAAVAGVGIADRRDHSAPPHMARRESVSTAPTNTNITETTNNTNATSVDDTQDLSKLQTIGLQNGSIDQAPGSVSAAKVPPELLRTKTDSILGLDMKIPGRYPPTNVAA